MTVNKLNLYDENVFGGCLDRIEALTPESLPLWGKMDSAQMMAHCAEIIEVSSGKDLKNTPFMVKMLKKLIRRMVLSDKPYRRDMKTHPQYIRSSRLDFDDEKERLVRVLKRSLTDKDRPTTHPLLGILTPEERGAASYKHLNHHLEQFGV